MSSLALIFQSPSSPAFCLPVLFVSCCSSFPPPLLWNSPPNNPELWVVMNDSYRQAFACAVSSAWNALSRTCLRGKLFLHSGVISMSPQDVGIFL